jgi:uncharacterized protein (DUF2236 family)
MREHDAFGLFGPGSMTWQVDRELMVLVGSAGRAIMLQVAHPLVAAAVAEHSRYQSDPFGRLKDTLFAIYDFAFADARQATRVVETISRLHGRDAGRGPEGTPYRALDPHLLLWVYATLIDSSLLAYDTFVARLTPAQQNQYYAEFQRNGPLWGIPADLFPPSYAALRQWMAERVASGDVRVTDQGRRVGRYLLEPPVWWYPPPIAAPMRLLTLWLLPEPIRSGFGYAWGPRRERSWRTLAALSRAVVPRLPRLARDLPPARAAERRVRGLTRPVPGWSAQ